MPSLYHIPGFEPDEIRDMAKSALRQVRERQRFSMEGEALEAFMRVASPSVALGEEVPAKVGGYIRRFNMQPVKIHNKLGYVHLTDPNGDMKPMCKLAGTRARQLRVHHFNRQLDSAKHGQDQNVELVIHDAQKAQ